MSGLGELRQHPDYPRLVLMIQKKVDRAEARVVRAATEDTLDEIRYLAGRQSLATEILTELAVKED